jgi:hypothetical protein
MSYDAPSARDDSVTGGGLQERDRGSIGCIS